MPRIPTLTTLRTEDYPSEQRSWLPRLFLPLNQFFTVVTSTLNGRVTFGDNIPAATRLLSFVYDGQPQRIPWTEVSAPQILWVGSCTEEGEVIGLLPVWSYDFSSKIITVNFLKADGSELTVGNLYKITIRAVP